MVAPAWILPVGRGYGRGGHGWLGDAVDAKGMLERALEDRQSGLRDRALAERKQGGHNGARGLVRVMHGNAAARSATPANARCTSPAGRMQHLCASSGWGEGTSCLDGDEWESTGQTRGGRRVSERV